jgi:hypothetical protein
VSIDAAQAGAASWASRYATKARTVATTSKASRLGFPSAVRAFGRTPQRREPLNRSLVATNEGRDLARRERLHFGHNRPDFTPVLTGKRGETTTTSEISNAFSFKNVVVDDPLLAKVL